MSAQKRSLLVVVLGIAVALVLAGPALAKKSKTFLASDDAEESDGPQRSLPDYSKPVAGVDADWVLLT